ncbi:MAG TPA: hypothetical protein EYH28_07280 [Anaerolineaceae bacterium]|nr:hypothetical protein [Anaerolineales bacterium]HIQ09289.1 hypothetical protein [Anaerolineaceae bacterium]
MDVRTSREHTWEMGGYALALSLALFLRLVLLGRFPLGDAEAALALKALALSQGQGGALGTAPLYALWTAAVFFLLGATDFTARLVPAVVGSALVLLPWWWRRWVGREVALALAFGLAVAPTLVGVSRVADGPALAVTFTLYAVTWAGWRRWPGAVLWAGLALLAGPATELGLLGLLLAGGVWWRWRRRGPLPLQAPQADEPPSHATPWLWGALAWVLAATLLGTVPAGLGGMTQGVVAFAHGWVAGSGVPWWAPGLALFLAAPWAWGFAVLGVAHPRPKADDWRVGAALWAAAALAVATLYPARQPLDAVWASVPGWALAVDTARRWWPRRFSWQVTAQAAVVLALSGYLWLSSGLAWQRGQVGLLALLVLMALMLMATLAFWMAYTASWRSSLQGLLLGLGVALALLTWRGVAQSVRSPLDVLRGRARPADLQVRLLQQTVARVAEWSHGRPDTLEVVALQPPPALRWALRGVHSVRVVSSLGPEDLPESLLTPADFASMENGAAYRGQDFLYARAPLWVRLQGWDAWARWFFWGQAPREGERVLFWVRVDRFPGGAWEGGSP